MLSDEEKKVIEYFKRRIANKKTAYTSIYFKIEKLDKLINLIEKQSKEIEELKEERLILFDTTVKNSIKINDKKWKDKIKAEIEKSELLIDNSQGCMSNEDLYKEFGKIEFGQSLLEKE